MLRHSPPRDGSAMITYHKGRSKTKCCVSALLEKAKGFGILSSLPQVHFILKPREQNKEGKKIYLELKIIHI